MSDVSYNSENIRSFCDFLAGKDADLEKIIVAHGYPTPFSRKPGFAGLIRLILEQQVSLMSAKAAFVKLLEKVGTVSPENILLLTDEELRQCYFSRQKTKYAKTLAEAVISKKIRIEEWSQLPDEDVRRDLVQVKGIGLWTADNYLLLCLQRTDIFPIGDIALLNSIKKIKQLSVNSTPDLILQMAESWRPFRSVATLLFWHAYIVDRKINIKELEY